MKLLSAFIAILIILINGLSGAMLSPPLFGNSVFAEEFSGVVYAKAEVRDAYVCSEPSSEFAMFAIPYTYCAQVLSESGDWYRVKYAEDNGIYRAVYGYCLKSSLTLLSEIPQTTYLHKTVTVKYTADTPSTSLPVLGEITVTAAYYGTYYQGPAAYSYVLCDGSFGYISGANDDYPLNTSTDKPPSTETPKADANVQLIVAVCLGVLASAALLLLFFGNRKKPFTPMRD